MVDSKGGEENDKNQIKFAASEMPRLILDMKSDEICMPSCEDERRRIDYYLEEEADVLNMGRIGESSLASPENGCSLESCTFLDNSGVSAQWWDF